MTVRHSLTALCGFFALAALGCSQAEEGIVARKAPAAQVGVAPPVKVAPPVALVQAKGGLTGTVTWADAMPEMKALDLKASADAAVCQAKGPVMDEFAVVNPKNKGLRDVFVWLELPEKGAKFPIPADLAKPKETKVVLDQPQCAFIPHALALREGQILVAKNTASIAHNFKWQGLADGNAGNKLLPPGGEVEIDLKADRLPISIECNIHPWMKGYVRVYDHPYFAVTDADGKFTIPNVPAAGAYKLKIWHGSKGWLGQAKGAKGQDINITGAAQDAGSFAY
jgi:hypothetical protein